jgi:hypothetical protein
MTFANQATAGERAMQPTLRLILASAILFAAAQASATEHSVSGVEALRPDASTGAIHLAEVGDNGDLMRVLQLERGKSVLVKTSY